MSPCDRAARERGMRGSVYARRIGRTEPSQAAVGVAGSRADRLPPTLTNYGPAVVRIASYNVENLFARPKVFRTADRECGRTQARGV
jgi:hypothetical protein